MSWQDMEPEVVDTWQIGPSGARITTFKPPKVLSEYTWGEFEGACGIALGRRRRARSSIHPMSDDAFAALN
jgi:hypothetical protein